METAVGVFQHLKANLLKDTHSDIEEFPSEYSDDYNSIQSHGNVKILSGSRRTVSCQQLPSSPSPPVSRLSVSARRKVFIDDGAPGDSGFNSDPGTYKTIHRPQVYNIQVTNENPLNLI